MACGNASHGDGCDHSSAGAGLYPSLYACINVNDVHCLNELAVGSCKALFKPHDQRDSRVNPTESQPGDPQLLLHVPFTGALKIMGISLSGGGPVTDAPSHVKLFTNKPELDFSNIDSLVATQEISLARDESVLYYPLRYFPRSLASFYLSIFF